MGKKEALIITLSWLLLVAFIMVSANKDNARAHTPTSKHMVYYPQGKVSMILDSFFSPISNATKI